MEAVGRARPIDGELLEIKEAVLKHALDYGLDFYDVRFEVCDYDTINILAAQGGFPSRYPHWRFGMEYDQLSKGHAYGLQRIFEMVINTQPCYAYLLKANNLVDQKMVMAHVYGHADFFKNNLWFKNTNRKMMDVMANNGTKIRRYMERYGQEDVETFIDAVLSLENLLDVNVLFETDEVRRRRQELEELAIKEMNRDEDDGRSQALRTFINAKRKYEERDKKKVKRRADEEVAQEKIKLPTRDIMKFLMENAPIKSWQADIIGILREEAYYFLPQRMTKIMNEGWASYWHAKIMTERALKDSEIIDFSDRHSGVTAMSRRQINPYKIGIELFRDIEHRWDTGKFGKDYQSCSSMAEKENWNKNLGLGKEKIFEVRKTHNDITFIDEFFTPEFCERQQLFTYRYNPRTGRYEIEHREVEEVKQKLLAQLTNFGNPIIEVESANFGNRSELLLRHVHQGVDLDMAFAADTMRNIYRIWKRPINLITKIEGKEIGHVFDGRELRPHH